MSAWQEKEHEADGLQAEGMRSHPPSSVKPRCLIRVLFRVEALVRLREHALRTPTAQGDVGKSKTDAIAR